MKSIKKISFFALVLLIISAVDSNRNLPSAAIFGAPLIFFFLFASVFFLFPSALVAAELSAAFPKAGGIYHWVRTAFGEKWGFVAIWLQWISNIAWYPTILSFIAGTSAYLFDPALVENKTYMVCTIAGLFWLMTIANLWGLYFSAKLNGLFTSIGTVFPMLFLIALGVYWIIQGNPPAISISADTIFPPLTHLSSWTALEAVMGAFLGMELAGVHVNSVQNPQKTFPKALSLSSMYILFSMLMGSLTIAVVLPFEKINLAGGLMQVFHDFFHAFHLDWLILAMSLCIIIGSIGGIINWIISPAKGLLHAAEGGYLPPFLFKLNRHGVATRILILQAVVVTVFCSVFLLLPTVNAFYWFLTVLCNCLYMSMYALMFCAALKLRPLEPKRSFKIPFGQFGLFCCCICGLIGAIITIIFGFFPPSNVQIGSPVRYVVMITLGTLLLLSPIFLLFYLKKKRARNQ